MDQRVLEAINHSSFKRDLLHHSLDDYKVGFWTGPPCIGVRAAIFSRRASRNCSKGLEETLIDGNKTESAIVDLFLLFARGTV